MTHTWALSGDLARPFVILACVLGAVLIVLMPLAHGSPIDPSSPGFWDNGDFDDVILFLTSNLHLLETDDRPPLLSSETVSEFVLERSARAATLRVYDPGTPRSPPAR